jgi:hypothetical protein
MSIKGVVMRLVTVLLVGISALFAGSHPQAQGNAFLGTWNLTGDPPRQDYVYWLEVKHDGGKLSALFLNRGGSPIPAEDVKVMDGTLAFVLTPDEGDRTQVSLRAANEKLTGTVTTGKTAVQVTGERPPKWAPCDANAKHAFGRPVVLFDGKSIDAWDVQLKDKPSGWTVEDGAMTNVPKANNLVSRERFKDFRVDAEYKLSTKGNSGIYLRGRYELQVLDDFGSPPESHGHMAIYGRRAPDVNASKPAGEWQTAQITIVGNCVTAVLNGKTVHDNARIAGITGGALDIKETEPGPLMIQGDHEQVWFRRVSVTPIVK